MRFLLTLGRVTIVDFTLFRIDDPIEEPDVIVVHHHETDEEEEDNGPGDIFGNGQGR